MPIKGSSDGASSSADRFNGSGTAIAQPPVRAPKPPSSLAVEVCTPPGPAVLEALANPAAGTWRVSERASAGEGRRAGERAWQGGMVSRLEAMSRRSPIPLPHCSLCPVEELLAVLACGVTLPTWNWEPMGVCGRGRVGWTGQEGG